MRVAKCKDRTSAAPELPLPHYLLPSYEGLLPQRGGLVPSPVATHPRPPLPPRIYHTHTCSHLRSWHTSLPTCPYCPLAATGQSSAPRRSRAHCGSHALRRSVKWPHGSYAPDCAGSGPCPRHPPAARWGCAGLSTHRTTRCPPPRPASQHVLVGPRDAQCVARINIKRPTHLGNVGGRFRSSYKSIRALYFHSAPAALCNSAPQAHAM